MRGRPVFALLISLLLTSLASCTREAAKKDPMTFENTMKLLDPLVDEFERLRQSLPPRERKRMESIALVEFRKQNHFLEKELGLGPGELKQVFEARDWIRNLFKKTKDSKELKVGHDRYNKLIFDIIGAEKFQRYTEFKVMRFKEFMAKVEKRPRDGA